MEDELIAMFNRISTNDRDSLVNQFAQIMKTDENLARFFLEAGSWSVEKAVHAYLAEFADELGSSAATTAMSRQPTVSFLSDLSAMQAIVFPRNHPIEMQWTFRNDGPEVWPAETRIVWVDGERMQGTQAFEISSPVHPGQTVTVPQRLITPNKPGTYAATWRLVCPMGYFGDPIWIIVAVGEHNTGSGGFEPIMKAGGDDMEML